MHIHNRKVFIPQTITFLFKTQEVLLAAVFVSICMFRARQPLQTPIWESFVFPCIVTNSTVMWSYKRLSLSEKKKRNRNNFGKKYSWHRLGTLDFYWKFKQTVTSRMTQFWEMRTAKEYEGLLPDLVESYCTKIAHFLFHNNSNTSETCTRINEK